MTPEERQLLDGLFDRIRGAAGNPRDRDAEALIAESVRSQPYAPYLLAQTVIVQEEALKAAGARIDELDAKVRQLEESARAQEANAASGAGGFLGGIGKSLFGGDQAPRSVPRVPQGGAFGGPQGGAWGGQPAQQPAPGPWGGQQNQQPQAPAAGGSFLKGALGTAAGIAGGMLLANSLSGLFSNHGNSNPLGIGSGLDKSGAEKASHDSSPGSILDERHDQSAGYQRASHQEESHQDDDSSSGWGGDDTSEA